ncbi:type 1 glutamine amidotransferase domain-containing protein [Emticicia sp. C21]|uniref:type 1 glutamine amidotransferase domain-containing protein n=1 Tax=Emticicia sp. C21 TaxID=2302915 RepID=UPI0013150174|nr:type 1 glutamine amidotransferase domain-containing protein [Emticicia sp. C21]
MKTLNLALIMVLISLTCFSQIKKVLIVATNIDSVGTHKSGTYLMEIAYPFQYFIDKGFEVDILTPKGGKTSLYDNGKVAEDLAKIQKNELFIKKTNNSLSPVEVKWADYSAVFYPGGHGQYFDVMYDERIALITSKIYEKGGIVGTAGHGIASLVNVQLSNCQYLVQNKRITCFPHWAELRFMNISNYGKLLPFDMEVVLARRGANLIVCTPENRPDKNYTHIVDATNRIVTGAFAVSAQWVAEEVVKLIK